MQRQTVSMNPALDAFCRAQFAFTDVVRRAEGAALDAFGLGPDERPYRIVASGPFWRLRDYADRDASPALLIVAAPIKRPYIWDLAPSVSAVRFCLQKGLRLYLLEWTPGSPFHQNNGLDEYADAVSECVAEVSGETRGARPFLIGHSLGGSLAAMFAASAPERVRGLVLLSAPLCFQPEASRFGDALVSLVPLGVSGADPCPGSLLSYMSALASPDAFVWSRLRDAAGSVGDRHALDIHGRVERWALDEVPLPGKLVCQFIDWLYREDRFYRGTLKIDETLVGPFSLSVPTLAVVNTADEVCPLASVEPFIEAMREEDARIVEYPGENGIGLQHLGILIGRQAHARVWPQIISWLESRNPSLTTKEQFGPG